MTEIIEILYKGTEFQIELNKQNRKYNFDLFLENLKEKITDFTEKSSLKLMSINTKEPYLLINEDNFEDIINHERNGNNLKIIVNLIQNNLNSQTNYSTFKKRETDVLYEKQPINDENINKESQNKSNNNLNSLNNQNNLNDEFKNLEEKNNNILKGESSLKSEEIYKKLKENEQKYIEIKKRKKNPFKGEICMICNKEIEYVKYLCCFCDRFLCCENCEKIILIQCLSIKIVIFLIYIVHINLLRKPIILNYQILLIHLIFFQLKF